MCDGHTSRQEAQVRKVTWLIVLAMAMLACSKSAEGLAQKSTPEQTPVAVRVVSAPVVATAQPVSAETTCAVTGDLNIRSGPGMEWGVIGWLYAGESVTVSEDVGDWLRLESGGYVRDIWMECER